MKSEKVLSFVKDEIVGSCSAPFRFDRSGIECGDFIEYLRTQHAVREENLGNRRILLSDNHRRRLAFEDKVIGRKRLEEIGILFTPDTILPAPPM